MYSVFLSQKSPYIIPYMIAMALDSAVALVEKAIELICNFL